MRIGLLTIVFIAVTVWSATGQEQVDYAKYELIRETVNFLATDKAVSQDTNFKLSCEKLDYDCFKQQLASRPIAGIERWYNSWQSITATDEAGLVALRDQVFADIFERPGKSYRKQLVGYEPYLSRIEELIHPPLDDVPLTQTAVDTTTEPLLSPTDLYSANTEQHTDQIDNPEKENTMIAYFALAIGIIALIIAVLPLFRKREQQLPIDFQGLQEQLDDLAQSMKRLDHKIADSQVKDEAINNLTDIMESIEKRVVDLEIRSRFDSD